MSKQLAATHLYIHPVVLLSHVHQYCNLLILASNKREVEKKLANYYSFSLRIILSFSLIHSFVLLDGEKPKNPMTSFNVETQSSRLVI